ncbi:MULTISPECIES: iron-containing alcohol dehydrogenase [unclassified Enterococcus]|uniref:iron-containing alcohol dehydrogenase n=1 Tax=unclassified Enterococcus TaxID=2608891 RepID=UPI0015521EA8|nr:MULTISPECIES: iron-containing alcohol dehydrogenase [unclassified Enterococcus]MBS7576126.1 iron-containing alcohol dehydrogenase [Enterococcus sp. MMGLQ5-2]MBS7583359.1 iron-containing alcohol dehydrogenase [Enterococcus sp. MMGLQ5-1]NPD11219.1 iron-containing alcohol dehydrogenase [Enterococcus sp. MMGLQ5-1]NPD35962.1 iron-containing alcohol dehydrogenase [Enterococcus sp. MMGLQ5-2]
MNTIFMPTKVFIDFEVLKNNQEAWLLGKTALLVTGRKSAKISGAESDVINILKQNNISFHIYNQITNDPTIEMVEAAAEYGKSIHADFIIGIGGGSPIDASKAIAVLCADDITREELFSNHFSKALPIVAIPTTAGTGSEVTPYSVLYRQDLGIKMSFGSPDLTFPKFALIDAKYTETLRNDIAIYTAIDAFTHSFEGFLSNRATNYSDMLALSAMKLFGEIIDQLSQKNYSLELRKQLLYISMIGGIVISHTGVTIVHAMGYAYTVHYNIPHGQANGFLLGTYLDYLKSNGNKKLQVALDVLGITHQELIKKIDDLIGKAPVITDADVELFTEQTLLQQASITNTHGKLNEIILLELWKNEFRKSREMI